MYVEEFCVCVCVCALVRTKGLCKRVACARDTCAKLVCGKSGLPSDAVKSKAGRSTVARTSCSCHEKPALKSPSATPAKQNEGAGCSQAPQLPRRVPRRHGRLTAPKHTTRVSPVPYSNACHAKRSWMSPSATLDSATPATQSAAATWRPSPVPKAPCLPRKAKVEIAKRRTCHAARWMSPSATPATQSATATQASQGAEHATRASPVP